jgi:5,10-methylenetetrahydromethanopterin reductase
MISVYLVPQDYLAAEATAQPFFETYARQPYHLRIQSMTLTISTGLNSSLKSHEHAVIAEQLGYKRALFYDSPAMFADVWVQLCRAAERTSTIGLGPGVMVPSLRHPMVTATAIATLASIAGRERVIVAVGSGFTGRVSLGQRPLTWGFVTEYLNTLLALLRGEEAQWEGATIKMMHYPDWAPARPIDIPLLIAVQGPKGVAAARDLAKGVITVGDSVPGFDWNASIMSGTVMDDDETLASSRVLEAAGPMASLAMHMALEFYEPSTLPNGVAWSEAYQAVPEHKRHLAVHDGHASLVNEIDRPFLTPEVLGEYGNAMDRGAWRAKLDEYEAKGVTELIFQPVHDIPRELEAFMSMATA